MEFTLTHPDSGLASIVVLFDGVPYEANSDHPWWDEIVDLLLEDDPRVLDLFPIRPVQQPSTLIEELVAERDTYMRRLALALEATKGWELLFEGAVRYSLSLRDRASLLESAVKTYASHVWNDIESLLSGTDV